jgi:hypothetical protein
LGGIRHALVLLLLEILSIQLKDGDFSVLQPKQLFSIRETLLMVFPMCQPVIRVYGIAGNCLHTKQRGSDKFRE